MWGENDMSLYSSKPENTAIERSNKLQLEWETSMPCLDCKIAEVCKYKNIIKRPDYPSEVFDVVVICKLKDAYK